MLIENEKELLEAIEARERQGLKITRQSHPAVVAYSQAYYLLLKLLDAREAVELTNDQPDVVAEPNASSTAPSSERREVWIVDHTGKSVCVNLANCRRFCTAQRPATPQERWKVLYGEWLDAQLRDQRTIELWEAPGGLWLAIQQDGNCGVTINLDQLRDLQPLTTTTTTPAPSLPESTGCSPPTLGLLAFDLRGIFRCAVELGGAIAQLEGGAAIGDAEIAGRRLIQVLNPRQAKFPSNWDWDNLRFHQETGAPSPYTREPRPGWTQELDLADASPAARQALLTIGLALADLRGDPEWHVRGRDLLSAGAWNLWTGMDLSDRQTVRHLLAETHRVWNWPSNPVNDPGPFTGPVATLRDPRILTPGWRTGGRADLDTLNDIARLDVEKRQRRAYEAYGGLPIEPPYGTPQLLAEAYGAAARALVHACYFKLHVLPVGGTGNRSTCSDLTRQRRLQLPWGPMTTEEAAKQTVDECEKALAAYRRAELILRAAVAANSRCVFSQAIDWLQAVANTCSRALADQLPWDQAVCGIYTIQVIDPAVILEQMLRQVSLASVQVANVPSLSEGSMTSKILFLASNPKRTLRLRLDHEVRDVAEGLKRSIHRERFEFISQFAVRVDDLRRALLDNTPRIVHFAGHGAGADGIVLENDRGTAYHVPTDALAELFALCAGHVECVVLNACYSDVQAQAIAKQIPYVIGMSAEVSDDAARAFAIGFYDALGAGKSIEEAYRFGCNAIALKGIPERLTPVLRTNC